MEVISNSEDITGCCIPPEVILVEGLDESTMTCALEESLDQNPSDEITAKAETDDVSAAELTSDINHHSDLADEVDVGRWQVGSDNSIVGVEIEYDQNMRDAEERADEVENQGLDFENSGKCSEAMEFEELVEVQEQKLPLRRGRPIRKRGRKVLPRKTSKVVPISRQNIDSLTYPKNFELGDENPNIFQVALKMTMRTTDERKSRPAYMMPTPVMKRASLSLQDKICIIQELATGQKQSTICKKQGLPKSTVQSIWKNREKIQGAVEKIGMNRKRCRRAQHEDVEDRLVEWINNLKAQSVPVNGPQLRAKAQVMAKQMGLTEFRCSTGWLDKFKTRHRIIFKKAKTSPRNVAAGDRKIALDWVTKVWPALCEGYPPCDIFNVDEAGIFFRAPPDKAHRLRGETCHGGKMSKDRITVLLCANSEGTEKLKINAVGNISHPKSFDGISNLENLPAVWHYNSRSWITRDIFVAWLRNWDEMLRSSDRQIIVILDNSPAHATTEQFTNIKLVFLPPIVASILQPLEHGVIAVFKLHYRRLLLDRMVRKAEADGRRTINILEALTMVGTAWTEVSPDLITDCFRTSNLQSLMVPDTGSGNSSASNEYKAFLRDEPKLLQQAIRVGIPIPDNVGFKEYALIDSSLHVTDYINDSASVLSDHGSGGSGDEEEFVLPIEIPLQREVQGFIDAIRNWAMMSTAHCDTSIHTALSVLESYTLRAKPPTMSTASVGVNVELTNEQDIPVSVIVSSQNGAPDSSSGANNLTITAFDASQQMVHIPISIHSQSTELVTLTALEPSATEGLGGLELVEHNADGTNSGAHSHSTHLHQTIHFQNQQPQFFAYLE